jgi:hypothetical protein
MSYLSAGPYLKISEILDPAEITRNKTSAHCMKLEKKAVRVIHLLIGVIHLLKIARYGSTRPVYSNIVSLA